MNQIQIEQQSILDNFAQGVLPITNCEVGDVVVPKQYRQFPYSTLPHNVRSLLDSEFVPAGNQTDRKRASCVLVGNTGTRKTCMAWAISCEWIRRLLHVEDNMVHFPSVVFLKWQLLLKLASASESYYDEDVEYDGVESINPNYAKRMIRSSKEADLLVIDDVGTQQANTEARVGKVYEIMDARWERLVPGFCATLMTTNAQGDELSSICGGRLKSRSSSLVIPLKGADERQKQALVVPAVDWRKP